MSEQNKRLRLLCVTVTPTFVWDDGESLTPGPQASSAQFSKEQLATLGETLDAEIARLCQDAI